MKDIAINRIGRAPGADVLTCDWCCVLVKYGVNSTQAMRELHVYPKFWEEKLRAHAQYHVDRYNEILPDQMTDKGLTEEFKAKVLTRQPRRPAKVQLSMEDLYGRAGESFQKNSRVDNKPVITKLDTRDFAGFNK